MLEQGQVLLFLKQSHRWLRRYACSRTPKA